MGKKTATDESWPHILGNLKISACVKIDLTDTDSKTYNQSGGSQKEENNNILKLLGIWGSEDFRKGARKEMREQELI